METRSRIATHLVLAATLVGVLVLGVSTVGSRGSADPADAPQPEGGHERHIEVGDLDRHYFVYYPEATETTGALPLILAFHGGFGSPDSFARMTNLHDAVDRGYVVAYPAGVERSWNAGACCGPAMRRGVDDVAFAAAVVRDVGTVVPIDPARIYATGFSNGAKLALRLGCDLAGDIAAVAAVGATLAPDPTCADARPIPLLAIHGLADAIAPFGGGRSSYGPVGEQPPVAATISAWRERNRCSDAVTVTYRRGAATCRRYAPCSGGADVNLCVVDQMGHQWPGSDAVLPALLGPGSSDLSATEMVLAFFDAHPASR